MTCEQWQKDRKLDKMDFVMEDALYRYLEELYELRGFDSETSKEYARDNVNRIEQLAYADKLEYPSDDVIVDAISDLKVFGCGDLMKLNYDPDKCHEETLKEISSRNGDWSDEKGKWVKDVHQDPKTLYKADYSKCKV